MGEPEHEQDEEHKEFADGGKRKLDVFELAKQRAQEIASRIASDADSKRPRLVSENSSEPSFLTSSVSAPPSFPVPFVAQPSPYSQGTSKKISIPNGKVGVVIGKGGETIKNIQLQSGAKIQITKDQDADPHSLTRDVELVGTSEQINRAEELITDVIAETDAGGSASSAVHGLNTKQSGAKQFTMKVPNDKVGLLIGKSGETIKYMQSRSGARVQIVPLHLPPGETSSERTVYINGSTEQIEAAKELVNDVISGKRIINPSANSYSQPVYPAAGNWVQPGQPTMQQQPQYGYAQPGNQPAPSSYYGNYTQQPVWDHSNPSTMSQTPQQMTGYSYYGQQSQMRAAPLVHSYSYNQSPLVASNTYDHSYSQQTPNYGQNIPSQTPSQEQQKPYATSSYGSATVPSQPEGAVSSQSSQPAYPPTAYSQPVTNPQTYWTSSSFAGQPSQTGYDQTGYSQAAYGGMQPGQVHPPSTQPGYGQDGYPLQPSPAPVNYAQGTDSHSHGQPQLEAQSQSQPSNNGHSQALDS